MSVVIPCYNGSRYLRDTLSSVVAQTHAPLEIIVVDDGSTDASAAIAESVGPPIRVIRQKNQGESVARNRGIEESLGEWVAFLDADDLWLPEKLARQLATVSDDAVAIHTDIESFGNRKNVVRIKEVFGDRRYSIDQLAVRNCIPCPSSLIVRRDRCPRFPEWTKNAEDQVFVLELVRRGKVELVEEPLTAYRIHSESQSRRQPFFAAVRWHQTIARWVSDQNWIDDACRIEIEAGWERKLLRAFNDARRARAWDEFDGIRRYLIETFGDRAAVAEAVQRRRYPAWAYRAVDRLRWLRRGSGAWLHTPSSGNCPQVGGVPESEEIGECLRSR